MCRLGSVRARGAARTCPGAARRHSGGLRARRGRAARRPPRGRMSAADRPGHILVVDDNPVSRMVLERALERQGYAVSTAPHGARALELLHDAGQSIDVVLLDILMPELDGYTTLQALKADQ